ncbi:MAG: hypothetical protein PHF12_08185 [Candidatus Omnitrophica bacterium]|nr:hypothetical protein [Candidatus Omnitrophota bacterium]
MGPIEVPADIQKYIPVAIGVFVILLIARFFARYKGGNPLAALAKKLGLSLQEGHDDALEHDLRVFSFSGLGKVFPRLYYVMSCSKDGVRLKMFDYNGSRFAFGMPRFLFQTMGFGDAAGAALSQFFISPRTLYWRIALLFSRDIVVKDNIPQEFLKRYVIIVKKDMPVPKFRRDFFDKFLSFRKPYTLETRGNRFIFYRRGAVIPLRRMEMFYRDLQAVTDVLRQSIA